MITEKQWLALDDYLTARVESEESFTLSDVTLERKFGITYPFWKTMCDFAQKIDRPYTGDPSWSASAGEPTEIIYRRVPKAS